MLANKIDLHSERRRGGRGGGGREVEKGRGSGGEGEGGERRGKRRGRGEERNGERGRTELNEKNAISPYCVLDSPYILFLYSL